MEPDHLSHHVGLDPVVGRRHPVQVSAEFGESPVGAEQRAGSEPRRQHALDDQDALGDHQTFATGQVRPAVDAVEVTEVVEPRVGGVGDVDDVELGHLVSCHAATV